MEQAQKTKASNPYSLEFGGRAVRLLMEQRDEISKRSCGADSDFRQIAVFAGQPSRLDVSGPA